MRTEQLSEAPGELQSQVWGRFASSGSFGSLDEALPRVRSRVHKAVQRRRGVPLQSGCQAHIFYVRLAWPSVPDVSSDK